MTTCPVELTIRALQTRKDKTLCRKLARQIKTWREDDTAGYWQAIQLLIDSETLLRKVSK